MCIIPIIITAEKPIDVGGTNDASIVGPHVNTVGREVTITPSAEWLQKTPVIKVKKIIIIDSIRIYVGIVLNTFVVTKIVLVSSIDKVVVGVVVAT